MPRALRTLGGLLNFCFYMFGSGCLGFLFFIVFGRF